MKIATTWPLRRAIERRFPERPFAIEFWDGTAIPPTRDGGPTFRVRSPKAIAHALRAPGQLGLGRAYVSGELDIDDIDKVIEVLNSWKPPHVDRARLALAAARAAGIQAPPKPPRAALRPRGKRPTV